MTTVTKIFHAPTPDEMREIEMAARRARAEEMLRLAGLAAKGVKRLIVRVVNAVGRLRRQRGADLSYR